jgi:aspartate/methionine/tyrosine aminotransferase
MTQVAAQAAIDGPHSHVANMREEYKRRRDVAMAVLEE